MGSTSRIMLSDDEIAALTGAERRHLAGRLLGLDPARLPGHVQRQRRQTLLVITAACLGLIPWTVFLAITLPRHYETGNWRQSWIGFDLLLLVCLATTAYLGWRRRRLVVLTGFGSALLLVCDAWFDTATANGSDRALAIATAVFVELPLAALLLFMVGRLVGVLIGGRTGSPSLRLMWLMPVLEPAEPTASVRGDNPVAGAEPDAAGSTSGKRDPRDIAD